jgi:hypothetical protein
LPEPKGLAKAKRALDGPFEGDLLCAGATHLQEVLKAVDPFLAAVGGRKLQPALGRLACCLYVAACESSHARFGQPYFRW